MLRRRTWSQHTLLPKKGSCHLSKAMVPWSPLFRGKHLYCQKGVLALPQPTCMCRCLWTWGSCPAKGQPSNPWIYPRLIPTPAQHKVFPRHGKKRAIMMGLKPSFSDNHHLALLAQGVESSACTYTSADQALLFLSPLLITSPFSYPSQPSSPTSQFYPTPPQLAFASIISFGLIYLPIFIICSTTTL